MSEEQNNVNDNENENGFFLDYAEKMRSISEN